VINYFLDERVLSLPVKDRSNNAAIDTENAERFLEQIYTLVNLYNSSQASIFLSKDARYRLDTIGRLRYNDFDKLFRDIKKVNHNNLALDFYINKHKSMMTFKKSVIGYDRNSFFKTLSFEDQFFKENIGDPCQRETDMKTNMNTAKKSFSFMTTNDPIIESLKVKSLMKGVSPDAVFEDMLKLVASINNTIDNDDGHFIITNGNFDCEIITMNLLAAAQKTIAVKLFGLKNQNIKNKKQISLQTFLDVYHQANNDFNHLIFSNDIKSAVAANGSIFDSASSKIKCAPERLYYYLKTLNNIADYLAKYADAQIKTIAARLHCPKSDYCDFSKTGLCASKNQIVLKLASFLGCNCSCESTGTLTCSYLMYCRTWDAGNSKRPFRFHLKPSTDDNDENTVRIYFDWDDNRRKILVGMIEAHPVSCLTLQNNHDQFGCFYKTTITHDKQGIPLCTQFVKK
jgi:hypothetical protein